MALSYSLLNTFAASTSGSVTPTTGSLVLVGVSCRPDNGTVNLDPEDYVVSGGSLTWTFAGGTPPHTTPGGASYFGAVVSWWWAIADGGTFTVTADYQGYSDNEPGGYVIEVTGDFDPINPIGAVGGDYGYNLTAPVTSPHVVSLSEISEASSLVFAMKLSYFISWAPGTGWTELQEGVTTEKRQLQVFEGETDNAEWTTVDTSNDALWMVTGVIEVVVSAGSGSIETRDPAVLVETTASATGRSRARATATSSATFTAIATGRSLARAVGTAGSVFSALAASAQSSAGTAIAAFAASAVGRAIVRRAVTAAASFTGPATGKSRTTASGIAGGEFTAEGVGSAIAVTPIGIAGMGFAGLADGKAIVRVTASTQATFTALGVSPTTTEAIGEAAFTFSSQAAGSAIVPAGLWQLATGIVRSWTKVDPRSASWTKEDKWP